MTRTWTAGAADAALSAIARTPKLLVALDFDGTASELVVDPSSARARPEVSAALERLALLPDTVLAFVSGRSLHDLRLVTEHTDDSSIALAGSHGAQYWYPEAAEAAEPDADEDAVRAAVWAEVRPIVDKHEGVDFEPKAFGMGIHTRTSTVETEKAVFAEVDALMAEKYPSWRRRAGNKVLEFSSRLEGKDAAMAALRSHYGATGILFAGDDVTDEDAMRVLGPDDLGVRVGAGESAATLRVENPQQIAQLLEALADERASYQE